LESLQKDYLLAKEAAIEAGKVIMKYFQTSSYDIKEKSINNPVTTADYEANQIIEEILFKEDSGYGWLSEETVDSDIRLKKDYVWVVDPIDGTKEFIEGIPQFSISIGLVELGKPILGVIYNPAKNELFSAVNNGGAELNGKSIKCLQGNQNLSLLVSRSEVKRGMWDRYQEYCNKIEPVGSVAYKLGLIAAGRADIFATLQPKNEWDICAGHCIINESGGSLVDLFGNSRTYNLKNTKIEPGLIAGSLAYFESVFKIINM
jgi:myo-inositol-1(or 4)-monophosphatase